MSSFETSATVQPQGQVVVGGVPFEPGTEVEVSINPKRASAQEFGAAWRRVCAELRGQPGIQNATDDDIRTEVERFRAGQ